MAFFRLLFGPEIKSLPALATFDGEIDVLILWCGRLCIPMILDGDPQKGNGTSRHSCLCRVAIWIVWPDDVSCRNLRYSDFSIHLIPLHLDMILMPIG